MHTLNEPIAKVLISLQEPSFSHLHISLVFLTNSAFFFYTGPDFEINVKHQ